MYVNTKPWNQKGLCVWKCDREVARDRLIIFNTEEKIKTLKKSQRQCEAGGNGARVTRE